MTGLEKIIGKIEEESRTVCASIIKESSEEAERIIFEAQNEAAAKAEELLKKAQAEADRKIAVAKSSADTITRTKYLEVRNAVVNDIISAAYEEIEKLGDKEYFDLLYDLCLKNVETGECVMYLSKRDVERLPADFEDRINSEIYQKGAVQVSKTGRDIPNGFILDYGDFRIDCTLRAVFDEKMDDLRDILGSFLFVENAV